MPFNSNSELPKGVKGLPPDQQTKWRKIFNAAYEGSTCKDEGDRRDECASRVAWSRIGGKYKGNALTEFSMAIKSATHNKEEGTLRWKAVASDTDEDYYKDNMSLELFNDFIRRIENKELAPEEYRSTFWQGGMPYLSVSHYTDLGGKAVPGPVDTVFIDGNQLRSYGQFSDNTLGWACYSAICKDLYNKKAQQAENPIRISIAFLDFGHEHKSNGYEFIRESLDDICPECIKEMIHGEAEGKIFKKGQLVHLALTRVPANERTSMEVEKSMATTRKEDAASIIGDELAEEIEEEAKLVGKSLALVTKSEGETEPEVDEPEEEVEPVEEDEPVVVEEKAKKPEESDGDCPDGMSEEDCKKHKKQQMKAVLVEETATKKKGKNMEDEMLKRMDKIEKMISELKPVEAMPHELDPVFAEFKSRFDEIKSLPTTSDDKLHQLQDHFNSVGTQIVEKMRAEEASLVQPEKVIESNDLVQAFSTAMISAMKPVSDKLDLLLTQQSQVVQSPIATPVRKSIAPTLSMQADIHKNIQPAKQSTSPTPKLHELIRKSVDRNM